MKKPRMKDSSIENVFSAADKMKPVKISMRELRMMKESAYCRRASLNS